MQDLWLHLPLRYEDRTQLTAIRDLVPGQPAQIEGRVEAVERGFRYRPLLRVTVAGESRETLLLRFFHFNGAQAAQFIPGTARALLRRAAARRPRPGNGPSELPVHRRERDRRNCASRSIRSIRPSKAWAPRRSPSWSREALKRLPPASELELLPAESVRFAGAAGAARCAHHRASPAARHRRGAVRQRPPSGPAAARVRGNAGAPPGHAPPADRLARAWSEPDRGARRVGGQPAQGTAVFADRRAAARICRSRRRHETTGADAAPGAGRCRQRQDRGGGAGGDARRGGGQAGGVDGAHRTAGRAAPQ